MSTEPAARRVLLACSLVLALAGEAAGACNVRTVAEAPLRNGAGVLTVPASVAGQPASLLLDTGAEAGLITPEAARRLGLPLDPDRQTRVEGTGGLGAVASHVVLGGVALGGIALPARSVPVGELPAVPRLTPPVAGLLGADVLAGFDVELDGPRGRFVLHETSGDCEDPVPWPHETVPLRRVGDRLVATAVLDGRPLDALIDTGAFSVALDTDAAATLGATPEVLARDPGGVSSGVDLREVPFHWHRFATFAVGGVVIYNPVLTVTAVREATPVLLGASWFAPRRVWLSYATRRMFIAR